MLLYGKSRSENRALVAHCCTKLRNHHHRGIIQGCGLVMVPVVIRFSFAQILIESALHSFKNSMSPIFWPNIQYPSHIYLFKLDSPGRRTCKLDRPATTCRPETDPNIPISIYEYPIVPFSVYNIQCPTFQEIISPDFFQYPISVFWGFQRPNFKGPGHRFLSIFQFSILYVSSLVYPLFYTNSLRVRRTKNGVFGTNCRNISGHQLL